MNLSKQVWVLTVALSFALLSFGLRQLLEIVPGFFPGGHLMVDQVQRREISKEVLESLSNPDDFLVVDRYLERGRRVIAVSPPFGGSCEPMVHTVIDLGDFKPRDHEYLVPHCGIKFQFVEQTLDGMGSSSKLKTPASKDAGDFSCIKKYLQCLNRFCDHAHLAISM